MSESATTSEYWLEKALDGDEQSLGELLQSFRLRLLNIVNFRIDSRIRRRLDPADVLQEAFVEAVQRFPEYVEAPSMPFFLWLRFITVQKLLEIHRRHLGVKARDAARDVSINRVADPHSTSTVLADHLLGHQTSPSTAAMRIEQKMQLENALNAMQPVDREILALRHFEQLLNVEVARLLHLSPAASSNRYIRAVKRLKAILADMQKSSRTA